ncbi:murein DD-endopeptidase MepM/ murein hydrolase activator NlpD [Mesorhizobium sp. J18]|uniref:LysM peptidoglycan-binding domain-containing protein n=1 Tax=Mesorhizobium sp. J18 TaxID=935263 RepID=UPI0011999916|nr:LysM peptidoglycan-binding domain-containing protein [Mesorhizobium sp. J18]TWG95552.1 murein DD-endopeptidase MepM/ murein hydrolase activator NlpD [Mesorhizobium sp. J18]
MRFSVLKQFNRKLTRGAAIALVGGLAAGCSSDVTRFQDSIFTGSTNSGGQSYQSASLDGTYTGSVDRGVRPNGMVGGGAAPNGQSVSPVQTATAAPLSDVQRQPIGQSSQPAPALAPVASASPAVDSGITNTATQQRQVQTASLPSGQESQAGGGGSGSTVTISSGETVYSLSRRYGVPVDAILKANGMSDASGLQAGQKITIPAYAYSRETPVSTPDSDPKVASVQSLPTDTKLPAQDAPQPSQGPAERMAVIPQAPRMDERKTTIAAGQDPAATKSTQDGSYTVASGDTLYAIARKTGVSADRIKSANGLSDGYLQVGQKLQIPAGAATAYTQVSSAQPKAPDPIVTDTAKPVQEPKPAIEKVSYTPPSQSDSTNIAEEAEQVAALPPDSTGIGRLRWPVRGRVVSSFGSGVGSASNDGIDIGVPEGTPVKAAENGVVIYAGDGLKEFGKTVLVRHDDGLVTVYGHASDIKVKRGDTVRRGQEIALSGMSGNADRPKLHFEVRKDSAPVDPVQFLEK